jgi:DNA-binding ferritin-like protein
MDGPTFVAGLVEEMRVLFAGLGEQGALEAESRGRVEIPTLLALAMTSELEAADLAAFWLPTTPEIDAREIFAGQCGDEMKHYRLIADRLAALGHPAPVAPAEAVTAGFSPLYPYLKDLRTTAERMAAGPFAREAIAEVRNAQFIALCERQGDHETARLYRDVIQPEEVHHHRIGRAWLERHLVGAAEQEAAASAARTTLAIADELSELAQRSTGRHPIPSS